MSELHTNPVPLTQAYAEFIVGSHDLSPRAIEVTVLGFTDAPGRDLGGRA